MSAITFLAVLALAAQAGAAPVSCGMAESFKQPDDQGKTTVAVWQDSATPSLLFGDVLHVNTDGTRRSYDVGDFWGETRAVNNLCNAMTDKCAGLDTDDKKRARRILTQQARAHGWPAQELAATRLDPGIIPRQTHGAPCPEVDGYLVSATALRSPGGKGACDQASYVDAMTIPALVVPKRVKKTQPTPFEARGVALGDLAVVVAADGQHTTYAVIGDAGPAKELGEGSIALAAALLGKTAEPVSYQEIRGRGKFKGKGWDTKGVVVIFPGSRDPKTPYVTQERIKAAAAVLFDKWGGAERLEACRLAYKPR